MSSSRSEGVQYATDKEQRASTNSSRKNEAAGPKWKQHSVVDIFAAFPVCLLAELIAFAPYYKSKKKARMANS